MKKIYLLQFTHDDGGTWRVMKGEFFLNEKTAIAKAKRFNADLPELSRYEPIAVPISWDELEKSFS